MIQLKKKTSFSYQRELIALFGIALSFFLFISLFSFNAYDPSWFYYTTDTDAITNKCGVVGAQVAALLMYGLGGACLLLPFSLFFLSLLVLFNAARREWDRLLSLFLLIPLLSTLSALYRWDIIGAITPGGRLGITLERMLYSSFDMLGSMLIVHTLLLASSLILFRISFISLLYAGAHLFSWSFSQRTRLSSFVTHVGVACHRSASAAYQWLLALAQGKEALESESIIFFETGELNDAMNDNWHQQSTVQTAPDHVVAAQVSMSDALETSKEKTLYQLPNDSLFDVPDPLIIDKKTTEGLKDRARILEEKLERFGVCGSVTAIRPGPVVTLFEYEPRIDTKISKIIALEDDLALALQALSIRIIAPIPGTCVVGFEVANQHRKSVHLSSIIRSKEFLNHGAELPLVLGEDTIGSQVIVDLARMPHMLVAGSTGSGKSVALNTMLMSLLARRTPDELHLVLIDPKRLEFAAYADIPHLIFPVVTEPRKAVPVLAWAVRTMEERYELMASRGVRTILDYRKLSDAQPMPYLVIMIDELADLMITAGNDVEDMLTRLSQMARAAGIHLIVATQRPSVDVITGLIKVNFPSRIAFRVMSKIDSRTILDNGGADKLLGRGDMLFLDAGSSLLRRVHGAYVSDKEIAAVTQFIRAQQTANYVHIDEALSTQDSHDIDDELFHEVLTYLADIDEISISSLQRRFRIGYNRSARLIDALESQGKILPAEGGKPRKVIRS